MVSGFALRRWGCGIGPGHGELGFRAAALGVHGILLVFGAWGTYMDGIAVALVCWSLLESCCFFLFLEYHGGALTMIIPGLIENESNS